MENLIKTERLTLKPFEPEDKTALSEILLNEEIKKTYMIPDFENTEALDKMVNRFTELSRSDSRFVRGIYLKKALIGFVNDVGIDGGEIELGYVIHPAHWGRGYATEMLKAVLKLLCESGFSVIKTGAFSENPASIRVMEKSGMVRCAQTDELEYRGKKHVCVYFERRK